MSHACVGMPGKRRDARDLLSVWRSHKMAFRILLCLRHTDVFPNRHFRTGEREWQTTPEKTSVPPAETGQRECRKTVAGFSG